MKSPESFEKAAIKEFLNKHKPALFYFMPMMNGFGGRGVPDIIGCYAGKMFAIEVKRPGKKPTPIQARRMAEIEEAGGKTFWGDASKVIGEFEMWLM